jgi:signal transduction histidine kinase
MKPRRFFHTQFAQQVNIFQSATVKLTALYVIVLAVICLFFSVNLYRVSTSELDRGLGQQMLFFQQNPQFQGLLGDDYLQSRQHQLSEARRHIIVNLVNVDLLIIIIGGIGSYFLARRTLKPIQEAHDAQARFTADASHELRTPIAAMQTEIEVTLRDPKLTKSQAQHQLRSNLEELAKLTYLSEGLLQLARRSELKVTEPVTLRDVFAQATERVRKAAEHRKISIEFSLKKGITVVGDQASLVGLVAILLDNAIKYSPDGTTVTIAAQQKSDEIELTVKDEGVGIEQADLPHIFDRFYRADTSRSKQKVDGYGLGLSIAKQIVEAHHGSISAKSTPGSGSTFIVKLPHSTI